MNRQVFKFSKQDGYAQRLCIPYFQILLLIRKVTRIQPSLPKKKIYIKKNSKQNKLWIGLNPNFMKNFTQLQHKFLASTAPDNKPTPTPQI
jgi:hypothetical protein